MKVLVTGANGYLGLGIVKQLIGLGATVVATDYTTDRVDIRARRVDADLFAIDNPYKYFEEPDVVLHLAWKDGFLHYSDSHINDLGKHYKFMQSMVSNGIHKFVGMGSMHEIGFFEGSINENTPCNPTTPYGIGKNALRELTEMICLKYNVIFQWLRGFYIVGNTAYGNSVFSKLYAAAERGDREFPFTMGINQFDFINYEEFCYMVAVAVLQDKINGIINVCSGRPEKLSDRMERFIRENRFSIKLKYGAFPDRPYDSKAVWGDNYKIKNIIEGDI